MKQGSTLFLKAVVFIVGIMVLSLCVFLLYGTVVSVENRTLSYFIQYIFLFYLYLTAIPFYCALYQTLKLLQYIDNNKAFSELSVNALNIIEKCAITISIMYIIIIPFFFFIAEVEDAPGVAALNLVIIIASIVIAVFTAVLKKLLKNAIDIKAENDLTV
ncbi:MAG: DUF2975 domain-containing protein [Clostridia bacterium]|nr:DUF2975 domain-containing protein [Clostridia bacterium]